MSFEQPPAQIGDIKETPDGKWKAYLPALTMDDIEGVVPAWVEFGTKEEAETAVKEAQKKSASEKIGSDIAEELEGEEPESSKPLKPEEFEKPE